MKRLNLILGGVLLCFSLNAHAQQTAPTFARTLSFQGIIAATNGSAVTGDRIIVIRLYSDANGDHEVWRDTSTAHIVDGVFSIDLGSVKPLPTADVMSQQLWVGMQIDRDAEMRPLSPLSAAPFALSIANNSVTKEKMATDYVSSFSVNGQKISGRGADVNLITGNGIDASFDPSTNTIVMNAGVSNGNSKGASAQASNNNILNQTTVQSSANFNISGSGTIGSNLIVAGNINTQLASGVVHSGGAGTNLSSSAVALGSDVSGTLPIANGGTGLAFAGSSGNFLKSSGSAWSSAAITHNDISDWSSATGNYATRTYADNAAATAQSNSEAYTNTQLQTYELSSHVTNDARAAFSSGSGIAISSGVISATNTGAYIDNSNSQQTGANFNIDGSGIIGNGLSVTSGGIFSDNGDVNINPSNHGNTTIGGTVTVNNNLWIGNDLIDGGAVHATYGFTIAGAAPVGHYLRGDGSHFTDGTIQAGDLPDLSGSYIDNRTVQQAGASFNIGGSGIIGNGLSVTSGGIFSDHGEVDINPSKDYSTNIAGSTLALGGHTINIASDGDASIRANNLSVETDAVNIGDQNGGSVIYIGSNSAFNVDGAANFNNGMNVIGVINAWNGITIANNSAPNGHVLRGDGSVFTDGTIQASDLPNLSASYIANGTSKQSGANFNIDGSGIIGNGLSVTSGGIFSDNGDVNINPSNNANTSIGGNTLSLQGNTINVASGNGDTYISGNNLSLEANALNIGDQNPGGSIILGSSSNVVLNGMTTVNYGLDVLSGVNSSNGYTVGNHSAPNGHFLRGDGTSFTDGTIQSTDLPNLSASYIVNSNAQQSGNFNINGTGSANHFNAATGYQIGGATVLSAAGTYNVFAGGSAGANNTSGQQNAALGQAALASNTIGSNNTAVGQASMIANTSGGNNTATGLYSMDQNTTGNANTASGSSAMFNNSTGSQNAGFGAGALQSNTTGSNNTALGSGADVASGALTNATVIGAGASVSTSNTIQLGNGSVTNVKTSGDVGVTTTGRGFVVHDDSNGNCYRIFTHNGALQVTQVTCP